MQEIFLHFFYGCVEKMVDISIDLSYNKKSLENILYKGNLV